MSINNVVAFEGWNSSNRAWNTSTWNSDVAYTVTATGQIGSASSVVNVGVAPTGFGVTASLGSFFTTNTQSAMTTSINSATITGDANVTVTGFGVTASLGIVFETLNGLSVTSSFGDVQTTNVGFGLTASVNSASIVSRGNANISVTGVSATGEISGIEQFPVIWGQVIPSQNPSWTTLAA